MDIPRYRIGNDLTVFWAIHNRDGSPYNFDGKEVHLFVTNDRGRQEVGFEFSKLPDGSINNVLRWDFRGDVQRVLGLYKLSIEIHTREDYRDITKDYSDAFVLVSRSEMECEEGEANVQNGGDLILSTRLDVYRIGVPKINIGTNGNWYIDGVDTGKSALGGGQGLVNAVYGEDDLDGEFDSASVIDTFNAYAINEIYKRVKDLTLPDVTDVFINSPLRNDILYYNGNAWENVAFEEFIKWFKLTGEAGGEVDNEALVDLEDRLKQLESMFYWANEEHTIIGTSHSFFSEKEISAKGLYMGNGGDNPGEGSGEIGSTTLEGLTDVSIINPADGEVLYYNGLAWVNKKIDVPDNMEGYLTSADAAKTYATIEALNSLTERIDKLGDIETFFFRQNETTIGTEYNLFSKGEISADGINAGTGSGGNGNGNGEYVTLASFESWKTEEFTPLSDKVDDNTSAINKILEWINVDADGNLFTTLNFYSTQEISAKGLSLGGEISNGGIIKTVLDSSFLGTVDVDDDAVTFNAFAIDSIYKRLVEFEQNGGGGGDVDVDLSDYYTKAEVDGLFTKDKIKSVLQISDWALKSSLAATDVPNLSWSKITSGKPTTLAGYGITDAMAKSDYLELDGSNLYLGLNNSNVFVRGTIQSHPSAWSITRAGAASFQSLTVNGSSVLTSSSLSGYATTSQLDNYLLKAGGTITGDLRLKGSGNYGNTIYFGDGSYCYLNEDSDDHLKIYGSSGINLVTGSNGKVTVNGNSLLTSSDLSEYAKQSWVNSQGFLKSDSLSGYATTSQLSDYLLKAGGTITGNLTVNGYVKVGSATLTWKSSALEVDKPFYSTGEISANGLYLGSDIRFKNQLEDISLDLETIANAPMFRFTWNNSEDESIHIGSSAQYWEEHARELVSIDDKDFHRLDYSTLGVLIGISLAKRIKELEMKIGG